MKNDLINKLVNALKQPRGADADNSIINKNRKSELPVKNAVSPDVREIKNYIGHVIEPEERTLKNYTSIRFWMDKRELYRDLREKEKQDQNIYQNLYEGARPTLEYYILTVLSCIIATSGLMQGSVATIIGAMIVAPLMTPILAFSLGVIWGDIDIIRISVLSLMKGIAIALIISALISFIIPMGGYSSEILSRTSPTMFDITVALASGLVGAYGNANRRISNTLVGIAIAVALMPPLCTAGIGIGTLNFSIASGALLLFVINLVSISLAGAIVFWMMKIHPIASSAESVRKRAVYQIVISMLILISISFPVILYMKKGYSENMAAQTAAKVIKSELPGVTILELKKESVGDSLNFTATVTGNEKPEMMKINEVIKKANIADRKIGSIRILFIQSDEIISNPGD